MLEPNVSIFIWIFAKILSLVLIMICVSGLSSGKIKSEGTASLAAFGAVVLSIFLIIPWYLVVI